MKSYFYTILEKLYFITQKDQIIIKYYFHFQ